MLIAKGYDVRFGARGKKIAAPASYGMLHDPTGADWPSSSVLVAPFSKDREEIDFDLAESYFGDGPLGGSVNLPPRDISRWTLVGNVESIDYSRRRPHGLPSKYEGDYYHFFDGSEGLLSILSLLFKAPEPVLYRRGKIFRMELPAWAELSDRGYIWP